MNLKRSLPVAVATAAVPMLVRKTIEAAWHGLAHGMTQALQIGTSPYQEAWNSRDFLKGNQALLEKRELVWQNK